MSLEVSSLQLSLRSKLLQEDIQVTIKDILLVCLSCVSFSGDQCCYIFIHRENNINSDCLLLYKRFYSIPVFNNFVIFKIILAIRMERKQLKRVKYFTNPVVFKPKIVLFQLFQYLVMCLTMYMQ